LFSCEGADFGDACVNSVAIAVGGQLTKDDIEFRKKVYANKTGERLSYRLYVPLGYDANRNTRCCFGCTAATAGAAIT